MDGDVMTTARQQYIRCFRASLVYVVIAENQIAYLYKLKLLFKLQKQFDF